MSTVPDYTPPPSGGGGGGGATVLGPFEVNFNTAGLINDPGAPLVDLTEGQWIIDIWVQIISEFDVADALFFQTDGAVGVAAFLWEGIDLSAGAETVDEDLEYTFATANAAANKLSVSRANDGRARVLPARVAADCGLNAVIYPSGDNPAEGAALVWMLVA